jgi:hypothetical protein
MSYERDKDKDTRGVGAIAALDKGNRARMRARAMRRRRSNALDRKLAEYTYRPGGGIGNVESLGMINVSALQTSTMSRVTTRGDITTTPTVKSPTLFGGGGPIARIPTRLYGGAGTTLQQASRLPALLSTAPAKPPSYTPPPSSKAPASSGPVVVGGGGAGYSTTPRPIYPGMQEPEVPDVPEDVATPAAASGPSLKTLALVGGAAVAAWWLFIRKKPQSSP